MREGGRAAWGSLLGALALALVAAAAQADLLRCMGPDGKWIYTDKKELCPAAKPFEPQGEIQSDGSQRSGSAEEAPPADHEGALAERMRRAEARRRASEAEEAEAQRWRDKKAQLEQALEKIEERRAYLEKFLALCNRGGSVYARDEAGIKRTVKCSSIRTQYASLAGDAERAREDLERLPEECRRAGCLPGWLR